MERTHLVTAEVVIGTEREILNNTSPVSRSLHRILTPQVRGLLGLVVGFNALGMLVLLVVMHLTFVGQRGCADVLFHNAEVSKANIVEVQVSNLM
mmetsp:Transcript_16224/g.22417  ORF Transcript_16224/g.22417 Transcript_16224/m.22417 type:complete len:95 (+) Transcript_16224:470-754(+)